MLMLMRPLLEGMDVGKSLKEPENRGGGGWKRKKMWKTND